MAPTLPSISGGQGDRAYRSAFAYDSPIRGFLRQRVSPDVMAVPARPPRSRGPAVAVASRQAVDDADHTVDPVRQLDCRRDVAVALQAPFQRDHAVPNGG